jgi:hypothetical protein
MQARLRRRSLRGGPRMARSVSDRFWRRVRKTGTCWLWKGSSTLIHFRLTQSVRFRPRRFAWMLLRGCCPENRHAVASCANRKCIRPEHTVWLTMSERAQLQYQTHPPLHKRRTHCPQGHPFVESNIEHSDRHGYAVRRCLACARAYRRTYYKTHARGFEIGLKAPNQARDE